MIICVYHAPLTLDQEILEKLCIICTDFLEFVAAKFYLNLAFSQLFLYMVRHIA